MEIVKLIPATKDYIWGGTTFKSWGKLAPYDHIAECWELSFNKAGPSIIASGDNKGKPLMDVASKEDVGAKASSFPFFPVLIKFIDSDSNLSVQVHPSDSYALKNEGQYGKTEMWYIISSKPHAGLYIGFKRKTNAEEVEKAIDDGSIIYLLNFVEVKPGETYFIKSGTVHAIGGGVTLMEIQQNSTLTYRLYDYKRLGIDGKPRELHVKKALKVLDYQPYNPPKFKAPLIGECQYFSSSVYSVKEEVIKAPTNSFASLSFLGGTGTFAGIPYKNGDTFFIPASKQGKLVGTGQYVMTLVK
jgi:mannose-6-phosphate isomerase